MILPSLCWMRLSYGLVLIAALLGLSAVSAHEIRPALLDITERNDGTIAIVWKQPVTDGKRLRLRPILPDHCTPIGELRAEQTQRFIISQWDMRCKLTHGQIAIEGLERTLTDVFVRIDHQKTDSITQLLRPDQPAMQLGEAGNSHAARSGYFWIGVEHMVFGLDHLLFVVGLVLLVDRRQIIAVITSFTIAHSITLALVALGKISLPSAPVEILIAASIVLLAYENIIKRRGQITLATRRPWLVAFAIGLIHGLGFAGALEEIGLPVGEELWALALFNIGLEAGQIAFVAVLLICMMLAARISKNADIFIRWILIYILGAIGSYWVLDRLPFLS